MERELPVGLPISRDGQNRAMTETYYAGRSAEDPATGRTPEAKAASGLTFNELWLRVGGDRGSLWAVLRNEVRRGRIDYHPTTRRYALNGGLDPAVRKALLDLGLADDRR